MREDKIEECNDKILDLNGDLEKAYSSRVATDANHPHARLEYGRLFEEK